MSSSNASPISLLVTGRPTVLRIFPYDAAAFPGHLVSLAVPDDAAEFLLTDAATENSVFGLINLQQAQTARERNEPIVGVVAAIRSVLSARSRTSRMTVQAATLARFILLPEDGWAPATVPNPTQNDQNLERATREHNRVEHTPGVHANQQATAQDRQEAHNDDDDDDDDDDDEAGEERPATANHPARQLFRRLTESGKGYLVAHARAFEDNPLEFNSYTEEEQALRALDKAQLFASDFSRRHASNSMWRNIIRRIGQPPLGDMAALSFWFSAALPPQAPIGQVSSLLVSRDPISRLLLALQLFKAHAPVSTLGASASRESATPRSSSSSTTSSNSTRRAPHSTQSGALGDDGSSSATSQVPSLMMLAVHAVVINISRYISDLQYLSADVTNALVDALIADGSLSQEVLFAVRDTYIRHLNLTDVPQLTDDWLLQCIRGAKQHVATPPKVLRSMPQPSSPSAGQPQQPPSGEQTIPSPPPLAPLVFLTAPDVRSPVAAPALSSSNSASEPSSSASSLLSSASSSAPPSAECFDLFPGLEQLDLSHSYVVTSEVLAGFLRCLPHLRELHLDKCKKLGDFALVQALPVLRELRVLTLSGSAAVGRPTFEALLFSTPELRQLDISGTLCTDTCIELLVNGSPDLGPSVLTKVTSLMGSALRITDASTATLAKWTQLRTLSLSFNSRISDWSFLSSFTQLVDLDLSLNFTVTDETVRVIGDSMPQLSYLSLVKTDISDQSVLSLAKLTRLVVLDLSRTSITDAIVPAFESMPLLASLSLVYTGITGHIASVIGNCPALRELDLNGCENFGDPGAIMLSTSACAPLLESLNLGGSMLSDRCVDALAQFTSLHSLQLWHTNITERGAAAVAVATGLKLDQHMRTTKGTWLLVPSENRA